MLVLHLAALAAIAVMIVAGVWQLGQYGTAQDDSSPGAAGPAVPLEDVMGPDDAIPAAGAGAQVEVHGTYAEADHQFLVSGREQGGRDGFWVVTPLLVTDTTTSDGRPSAILVVRGWQPTAAVPDVPPGEVRVSGVLQPGEEGATSVGADRVVAAIRIPALIAAVPFDLYSAFLIRTAEAPAPGDDLVPVPPPDVGVSWTQGLRNLAYGLQWWLFAGFAVFMWWQICREELARSGGETTRAEAPVG